MPSSFISFIALAWCIATSAVALFSLASCVLLAIIMFYTILFPFEGNEQDRVPLPRQVLKNILIWLCAVFYFTPYLYFFCLLPATS